jgi:hypothetical protein
MYWQIQLSQECFAYHQTTLQDTYGERVVTINWIQQMSVGQHSHIMKKSLS